MAESTDTSAVVGDTATSSQRYSGHVKWFNSSAGYGFVTVKDNDTERDVFVHHTGLCVSTEQYRYLVAGEYVELGLTETNDKYQAVDVRGVGGGKLMCETRLDARGQRRNVPEDDGYSGPPRRTPRNDHRGPRGGPRREHLDRGAHQQWSLTSDSRHERTEEQ